MDNMNINQICLGTDLFGTLIDHSAATGIFNLMRDNELNFIDTADSYGNGEAETMLGKILSNER